MKNQHAVFVVEIFPSEALQFLVPKQVFDSKYEHFAKASAQERLTGQRFRTTRGKNLFQGHDIVVKDLTALEPDILDDSFWESVEVEEVQPIQRGRRAGMSAPETTRINFWELIYPEEKVSIDNYLPKAFEIEENDRLVDVIRLFIQKKTDLCCDFLERVQENIANDYRSWIPAEMWLNLVLDRLLNHYYRS